MKEKSTAKTGWCGGDHKGGNCMSDFMDVSLSTPGSMNIPGFLPAQSFGYDDESSRLVSPMEVLTAGRGQQQLLYFTTSSLGRSGRFLWYLNEVDGQPNVHHLDLTTGEDRQLTHYQEGRLWQYQGFQGHRNKGFGVWSVALDAARDLLYYISDQQLCVVDAAGTIRVLAELPMDETTAFIDVSTCGRYICVPTTDARALGEPTADERLLGRTIDERCQRMGLNSYLNIFDIHSQAWSHRICVPRCWITHVQMRPGTRLTFSIITNGLR